MSRNMKGPKEDSPPDPRPSIAGSSLDLLATSCADAARAAPGRRLEAVLDRIVRWAGVDRAFVAEADRRVGTGRAVLVAGASRHPRGPGEPSQTALTRAVASRRSFLIPVPVDDPRLREGDSVRRLRLGFVAAFPIPGTEVPAAALLLDASAPLSDPAVARVESAAGAVVPLLRLLLDAGAPASAVRPVPPDEEPLVGTSALFRAAVEDARRAAGSAVPVLLCGETGTGKELFARMLHRHGRRDPGPFVAVNCAALPESLLEAELFGAVRGAYTGAEKTRPGLWTAAHRGTLFLDEIAEMAPALQAKTLRVLQDGRVRPLGSPDETEVDVRVVAATHRDLGAAIRSGAFRADLFWRLAVAVIRVPPLRDRPDDLAPLAEAVLRRLSDRWGLPRGSLSPEAAERLRAHRWPGNVRELQAVLARALLRAGGGGIERDHLEFEAVAPADEEADSARSLEVRMVRAALREARGRLTPAAARIGWSRQKLYRRLRALGLDRWGDRAPGPYSGPSEPGP